MGSFKIVMVMVLALSATVAQAQLRTDYYAQSCPQLDQVLWPLLGNAIRENPRNGAFALRMLFHDCFVQGCDASVLLDDSTNPAIVSEKGAFGNKNSLQGFEIIDMLKDAVEKVCPGVVSCADLIALAARDSVVMMGGPSWELPLGRRDSTTANALLADGNLPSPLFSFDQLVNNFQSHGFSMQELVALSGAHTIGMSQCRMFKSHIYNDSDIDPSFAQLRRSSCNFSDFDSRTAGLDDSYDYFDNIFFSNVMQRRVLLNTDQVLYTGNNGSLVSLVTTYANDKQRFFTDFATAMFKLGSLSPLTGSQGEIRANCHRVNNPAQAAADTHDPDS